MPELMLGTVQPDADADKELMKAAGVEWVRLGAPLPFADRPGGEVTDRYRRYRQTAAGYAEAGIRIVGVTPGPGSKLWRQDEDGEWRLVWHRRLPEWFGELGSDECLEKYEQACRWLGDDLRGIVPVWQALNELDWHQFSGPMAAEQSCEMILAAARGLKAADPDLIVGHNSVGHQDEHFLSERMFSGGLLDYCGVDRYFGSWHPGGPEDWAPLIEDLNERTGVPVLVNEWGFASAGGVKTEAERDQVTCACHKWPHTWGPGHTPEGQAEFIRRAFDAFIRVKDRMLGELYFRWADQPTCWQCRAPDCPAETAWGLVDVDGKPKPSYHALKESARRLRDA